ncbi:T9SS type A sorting domain-containing protein [Algibacter sp.]|nr:T9SS type A sorting domain-containing protein [Algibacter sp.]
MEKFYFLIIILSCCKLTAQTTEDFETEALGATIFTDNGQSFTISSPNGDFNTSSFSGAGWNGSSSDNRYIDNAVASEDNDGAAFTITTTDGTDIVVKSLYLFISTGGFINNTTNSSLTIIGKKDGTNVYTISKTSGFSNVDTFSPNNGYTLIDFSTEGGNDNSNVYVDELVFTTTNDGDYLGLDAFTWDTNALSIEDNQLTNALNVSPNPSTNYIKVNGLTQTENYKVYNVLGTEVMTGTINREEKISIQHLNEGMYFLQLQSKISLKFIKQ